MFTFQEFSQFVESLLPGIQTTVRKYMGQVHVDYKADDSPVTLADKEIERELVEQIMHRFPESYVVGEESGTHAPSWLFDDQCQGKKVEWVIDPIDGTKSFIHGVPLFTTLIGVVVDGKPTYGAIYNPLLDDLVTGDCETAFWNGDPTHVRAGYSLDRATLLTTDIPDIAKHRNLDHFMELVEECRWLRTWGDAYGYFLLATGRADIMVDPIMSRWDLAALIPVVQGAGGIITDYYGGDAATADSIVASTPHLHDDVIRILNGR